MHAKIRAVVNEALSDNRGDLAEVNLLYLGIKCGDMPSACSPAIEMIDTRLPNTFRNETNAINSPCLWANSKGRYSLPCSRIGKNY